MASTLSSIRFKRGTDKSIRNHQLHDTEFAIALDTGNIYRGNFGNGNTIVFGDLFKLLMPETVYMSNCDINSRYYHGSGIIESGNHYNAIRIGDRFTNIGDGMWVDFDNHPTSIIMGYGDDVYRSEVSNSDYPIFVVSGNICHVCGVNSDNKKYVNKIDFPSGVDVTQFDHVQDSVFIEVWHESIMDKGVVYPYGNVQYGSDEFIDSSGTAHVCDLISEFPNSTSDDSGYYSLFGDWQEKGDVIGKCIVWSDMLSDSQISFIKDSRNNIYLSDKNDIIQVRYRIRVISGAGELAWMNYNTTTEIGSDVLFGVPGYNMTSIVKPKASFASEMDDLGTSSSGRDGTFVINDVGSWKVESDLTYSTMNRCYLAPIAIVQRRNDGVFHPIYNHNGCGVVDDGYKWHSHPSTIISHDACVQYKRGGSVESGESGRPDGLYADEINIGDVYDTRYRCDIDDSFNYIIDGIQRGTLSGWSSPRQLYSTGVTIDDSDSTLITFDDISVIHDSCGGVDNSSFYSKWNSTLIDTTTSEILPHVGCVDGMHKYTPVGIVESTNNELMTGNVVLLDSDIASVDTGVRYSRYLFCDIICAPDALPTDIKSSGHIGTYACVGSRSGSGTVIPNGVITNWNLSKYPELDTSMYVIKNGQHIDAYTYNAGSNQIIFNQPLLDTDVCFVYYRVKSSVFDYDPTIINNSFVDLYGREIIICGNRDSSYIINGMGYDLCVGEITTVISSEEMSIDSYTNVTHSKVTTSTSYNANNHKLLFTKSKDALATVTIYDSLLSSCGENQFEISGDSKFTYGSNIVR